MNTQAQKSSSDLARLTIVVPSYERPQYVGRQIRYWNDRQATLLIVDGSARPLESTQTSGNSRLLYHHHVASFQHRMLRACDLITTEFVALCGDDDLYLPSGLRACIERLDRDPGMVGCVGRSLRFSHTQGDMFAQFINRDVADTSNMFASGLQRVSNTYQQNKIDSAMYGVYRTSAWQESVLFTYSLDYSTVYIYEFILALLLPFRGSVGITNHLTWMSSGENASIMNASGFNRAIGVLEWMNNSRYADEVFKLKTAVCDEMARTYDGARCDVEQVIERVFAELHSRLMTKASRRHRRSSRQILRRLLPIVPNRLKHILKKQLPTGLRDRFAFGIIPWDDFVRELEKSSIQCDVRELQHFTNVILEDDWNAEYRIRDHSASECSSIAEIDEL